MRFPRLELSEVARGYDVEVLPLLFLVRAYLDTRITNYASLIHKITANTFHFAPEQPRNGQKSTTSHFLYSLFDDGGELLQDGEVGQDLEEDGQRVPDLHVVLRLQAHDEGLGNPEATNTDSLGLFQIKDMYKTETKTHTQ